MEDGKIRKMEEIQAELERMEKLHKNKKISDEEFAEKSAALVLESINISQDMFAGMIQGAPTIPAEIPCISSEITNTTTTDNAQDKKKGSGRKGKTI